jgi:hypothetical protein
MTTFFTLIGLPLSYNTYGGFMKESELEVLCTDSTALATTNLSRTADQPFIAQRPFENLQTLRGLQNRLLTATVSFFLQEELILY